jgi:hypothetical protein
MRQVTAHPCKPAAGQAHPKNSNRKPTPKHEGKDTMEKNHQDTSEKKLPESYVQAFHDYVKKLEDRHLVVKKGGGTLMEGGDAVDEESLEFELDEQLQTGGDPTEISAFNVTRHKALPPIPWTGAEYPLALAKDGGFFGKNDLSLNKLVHAMFLGGTGVGKTTSGVVPLMRAQIRYSTIGEDGNDRQTSMLIIDPKCELLSSVQQELDRTSREGDLIHLGANPKQPPLGFFEPNDGLTVRDKVKKLDVLLQTAQQANGHHSYWHEAGKLVLIQLLNLTEAYGKRCAGWSLIRMLTVAITGNWEEGFWQDLSLLLSESRTGEKRLKQIDASLKELLGSAGLLGHPDAGVLAQFFSDGEGYTQWHYRLQSLHPMISLLAEASEAGIVDFAPFPTISQHRLDTRQLLDHGMVLLYQPEPTPSSALVARAIKVKVYECVKSRTDMERPIGIVIDEFQRFVTNDEVTGDAHFLDTARAYRANCILATQSVGAMLLALGNDNLARAAVDAILANTPSKWFFASKDVATRDTVCKLIPSRIGWPHLVDVRPLAQLQPGQAYWSLADGEWGLHRAKLDKLL